MKKILFNIFSALLVVAVFYFLGREFGKNWAQIRVYSFHFNFWLLSVSSLAYLATLTILAFGWHLILRYLHHPIPFVDTFLYFFITQPAKYIPGKIWIGVTRMKFCKRHAIPHSITMLTTGTEAVLEIMAGSYISLAAILQSGSFGKFSLWGTLIIAAAGLVLLIPRVFYFFINLFLKIVKREPIPREMRVSFSKLFVLQINYLIGMFCLGIAQLLFLQSFAPVDSAHFPFLISLGTFSYVASILAIFTPGGLGVREGIWYLALKGITLPHVGIIYAFVSRIWTIVIEALMLFICVPVLWIKEKKEIL